MIDDDNGRAVFQKQRLEAREITGRGGYREVSGAARALATFFVSNG
jgi:hypothetical protein